MFLDRFAPVSHAVVPFGTGPHAIDSLAVSLNYRSLDLIVWI